MTTRPLLSVPGFAIVALLVTAAPGFALEPHADGTRGRARLDRAVEAFGGIDRLRAIPAWYVEGRGRENLSGELQGVTPDRPTWRPHQEKIAVDARALAVAWERRTPRNDHSVRFRRFIMRPDSSGVFDWNAGRGRMRGAPTPEAERRAIARRVPHALLFEAATRASAVSWLGEVTLARQPHDVLRVTLPQGEQIDLTIARDTHVLRRASYRLAFPGTGDAEVVWEWPEWRSDPHLVSIPLGHRVDVNGVRYQEVRYDRFAADASQAASLLALPPNREAPMAATDIDAGADLPATGEVAPGVRVLQVNGFTVMFVEFKDFVVAIEAPENHPSLQGIPAARDTMRVTAAFLTAIRAAIPAKPIRYVIVSHHHSDHLGGIRDFSTAGATVIVAPGHRKAVLAAIADPALAAAARIETVAGRRVISDGERTLEIWNAGRNPHTDANLFVWLPKERIGFQGDLFYFQAGAAFPPPGRENINRFFARWLDRRGIRPRAIYGVHDSEPAGPKQIEAMLTR